MPKNTRRKQKQAERAKQKLMENRTAPESVNVKAVIAPIFGGQMSDLLFI
jgi:hypothetical protein